MSLCIECAMCCDGTLFSYLPLGEGEAARFEGEPGLHVEDGKDRLRQPCPRLGSDGACGIYADRPRICGQYRCRLLKRVDAGRMTEDAAQVVVARAKTFRNMARDLYLEATPDGHRPGPSVNLHAARRAFRRAVESGASVDRYKATDAVLQFEHFVAYARAHFRKSYRKSRSG